MKTASWIVVALVVLYLFRDKLFPPALASRPAPGPAQGRPLGYDYYGGPPPGPTYGSSPPTHPAWEAPAVAAINVAGGIVNALISGYGSSDSGDSGDTIDTDFVNDLPAY